MKPLASVAAVLLCVVSARAQVATFPARLSPAYTAAPAMWGPLNTFDQTSGWPVSTYTVQAFISGNPSACIFHVWSSTIPANQSPQFPAQFADSSGPVDCTQVTMIHQDAKPAMTLVVQVTSFTGATSIAFGWNAARPGS